MTPTVKSHILAAALACAGVATAAEAASIRIHKQPHFNGQQVTLTGEVPNLATIGFRNQVSSLVLDGTWEVCTEPNFGGRCEPLSPGEYPSLPASLDRRIESLRPLDSGTGARLRPSASAAAAGEIKLFKKDNFAGPTLTLRAQKNNLQPENFHDQVSSIVVESGNWEVCSRPNFNGDCMTLGPGRYAKLDQKINHRIESVRQVGEAKRDAVADEGDRRGRRDGARDERDGRRDGRDHAARGAIDIYPGPDFGGRPIRVDRDLASLEGNSERASSIVIHEGTWQLCTQAYYEGWCRTFEPGRYGSLGRLDNRVASAKQVR